VRKFFKNLKIEKEHILDVSEELEQSISRSSTLLILISMSSILIYKCGLEKATNAFHSVETLPLLLTEEFWEQLLQTLLGNITRCILAAAVLFWFYNYKSSALKEIRILRSLFNDHKIPTNWYELHAPRWIKIVPYLFFFVFFMMAFFVNEPRVVGAIMILLFVLDMSGNKLIQRNLKRYLGDKNYDPEGHFKQTIGERRKAAERYWLDLPQIDRILVCSLVTFGAWQISFLDNVSIGSWPVNLGYKVGFTSAGEQISVGEHIAYVLLTLVILGNELVMRLWRSERSREIAKANRMERHIRLALTKELDLVRKNTD
jgi:hypothetical protein